MGSNPNNKLQPRIYVACLAAHNTDILHGAWVNAAQEAWPLYDDVRAMLLASPIAGAEEWAIHDFEGFGAVRIEEYMGLEHVSELACFIDEHGEVGAALLEYFSGDLSEARSAAAERYLGAHATLTDYVQDVTEETAIIPASLRHYIDWKAMARDAEMNATCSLSAPSVTRCMCSRGAEHGPATANL